MTRRAPDPLDIPPFLRRKKGEKREYPRGLRPVRDIIAEQERGVRPSWQERNLAIEEEKKRLIQEKRDRERRREHPNQHYDRSLKRWVRDEPRKRGAK